MIPDRTGSLRDERHAAIVDAARALAAERGADGFTVDQVARAAGVSRRTVFNHFASIDALLVAVCERVLAEVTADLLDAVDRRGGTGTTAALDALCAATREVDLPAAIVAIHLALGRPGAADERAEAISRIAFEHVLERLRARLEDRAPGLDPLDLELTLTVLAHGLALIAHRWLEAHPDLTPEVGPDARAAWDDLLDHLLRRLRSGYAG